ncbi:MAG: hypothetical protein GY869_28470 [Planctomycetes bacterium]|nr:hypothetical protein [Planctomycetota bacterium]
MPIDINLKVNPYYRATKTLDGNAYALRVHWNTYTEKWYMSIEGLNNDVDIKGIALMAGKDLLAPYGYSDELGELWIIDNQEGNADPNYDDIGARFTLEYTPLS